MPKKYIRNRNTVTVSSDGGFLKSAMSGFGRQSSIFVEHLSASEKTFLNLKLLQKCQEKIFEVKENQYQQALQNRQDTNCILAEIKPQTLNQVTMLNLKGSQKLLELNNRQFKRRNSDCLISSWTAFVNLDITFKTRQADLLKENRTLHNKLAAMEEKLKALYPSKYAAQFSKKHEDKQNTQLSKTLSYANIEHIQKRINQHQILIRKLKGKIQKKETENFQIQQLFQILLQKCQQKYGDEVVEKLNLLLG